MPIQTSEAVPFPHIDEGAKRWLYNHARRNFWRVASWHNLDDLIQDGFVCWYRVVAKYCYPDRPYVTEHGNTMPPRPKAKPVTRRPHLMALFKLAYSQHIHDLAKSRTREPEVLATDLVPPDQEPSWLWDRLMPFDGAQMALLVAHAPPPIKAVLVALDKVDGLTLRARLRVRAFGKKETQNERLCRIAGLDPTAVDVVSGLQNYLRGVNSV